MSESWYFEVKGNESASNSRKARTTLITTIWETWLPTYNIRLHIIKAYYVYNTVLECQCKQHCNCTITQHTLFSHMVTKSKPSFSSTPPKVFKVSARTKRDFGQSTVHSTGIQEYFRHFLYGVKLSGMAVCLSGFLLVGYRTECCQSDDRLAPEDGTCIFSARINGPLPLFDAHIRDDDGPQVWRGLPGVKLSIRPPILHPSPDTFSSDKRDAVMH